MTISPTPSDGGPAFPREDYQTNGRADKPFGQQGMSMRDYFAAKALQGLCSRSDESQMSDEMIAMEAYRAADAMLKVRKA